MCEVDKRMRDMAAVALAKNPRDWQAYLLMDVAERRLARERELYGAEPPERGDGPRPLAASMAERIDDIAATVSELHAGSTGDSRRMIERRLRDLADAL